VSAAPAPRIVSLIASATEIVAALGFAEHLVGRSHECDHPESVSGLPICTEPKFLVDGSSVEIDQRVRAILRDGLSVYRVDAERLRDLRPDLVVTQSQCEVCAVSLRDVEAAACEWIDSRPRILSLEPNALADVFADVRRVADALGVHERGIALARRLTERTDEISLRAKTAGGLPTVAMIEWIEPLMACGNWIPELVELAGGANLFGVGGRHSPWLDFEDLRAADPEVVVVVPCGFEIEKTRREMGPLVERPAWPALRAVRAGRVAIADGHRFFNRPGPRLVESLEILAEILHPGTIDYGWRGRAWEWFGT
jgi:iron complex transport system substrate-binding protein